MAASPSTGQAFSHVPHPTHMFEINDRPYLIVRIYGKHRALLPAYKT